MDIEKSVYWGADYGKELILPEETVVSLEDIIRAVNTLLERSGVNA